MKENLSAGRIEFLRDLAARHPDSVNLEGGTVLALIDQIERLQGENSTLADLAKARHEWNKKNRTELKEHLEQAEQDRDKLRNRLDAMRRQRDGYRNQLRKTEQRIQQVRVELGYIPEDFSARIRRALDGEPNA